MIYPVLISNTRETTEQEDKFSDETKHMILGKKWFCIQEHVFREVVSKVGITNEE